MGVFDSIFGGEKSSAPVELGPQWARDIRENLGKAAEPYALELLKRSAEPFPDPLVAPLSDVSQQAMSGLGSLFQSPMGSQTNISKLGQEQIEKTLSGKDFEDFKSVWMKSYTDTMEEQLRRAKDRLAASTSSRDNYFGGGRIQGNRLLEEEGQRGLGTNLAQLYGQERQNQLQAAPLAMQFGQQQAQEPFERANQAIFGLGAAPAMYQQQLINAANQERQRQLNQLQVPLGVATQMSTFKPDYYTPSYGPSMFSQIAGGIGAMGGMGSVAGGLGAISGGAELSQLLPFIMSLSDVRAKENIKTIPSALDKIKTLDGKTYNYINGSKSAGIIAQDLEKVLPEGVVEIQGLKHIRFDAIAGLLINAVKELAERN